MLRLVQVGLGVVGTEIVKAHLSARLPIVAMDRQPSSVERLSQWASTRPEIRCKSLSLPWPAIELRLDNEALISGSPLLMESISERLEVKQEFFSQWQNSMGHEWVLATNTSTLPIHRIAQAVSSAQQLVGMHFFMPVSKRTGVEVIPSEATSPGATQQVVEHAQRLGRSPFLVDDQPGFVVNRMLAPYLNEAMSLLCNGAAAADIETAALELGMPLSPLELIDIIGTRTAFDGGRVYWSAFPDRMTPSPLLPGLVKRGRMGRKQGGGFYDYPDEKRSPRLSAETMQLIKKYERDVTSWSVDQVRLRLFGELKKEAACIIRDDVISDAASLQVALLGGLEYRGSLLA